MPATASAARMKSICSARWRSRSERRIRNSSPPWRATTSILRIAERRPRSDRLHNSSPAACPKLSLTSLKLSRSMNRTAAPLSVRAARSRAESRCSRNEARFARPVSESCSAAWASFSIASASMRLRVGDVCDHAVDQQTAVLRRAFGPHPIEHPARLAVAARAADTRPRPAHHGRVPPGARRTPRDRLDAPLRRTPPPRSARRGPARSGSRARRMSGIRRSRRAGSSSRTA